MKDTTNISFFSESVSSPELDMVVYHEDIYGGKEKMKIVGIRKTEVELEGDYSGGTQAVAQKSWMPRAGCIRYRRTCTSKVGGSCPLPNVHCGYPDCEPHCGPNGQTEGHS